MKPSLMLSEVIPWSLAVFTMALGTAGPAEPTAPPPTVARELGLPLVVPVPPPEADEAAAEAAEAVPALA
jgi:hypothetical protein